MTNISINKLATAKNSTAKKTAHQGGRTQKVAKKQRLFFIFKDENITQSLLRDPEILRLTGSVIEIHTRKQLAEKVASIDKTTLITVFHLHESNNPAIGEKHHREYKKQLRDKGFKSVTGHNIQRHPRMEKTVTEIKAAILKLAA